MNLLAYKNIFKLLFFANKHNYSNSLWVSSPNLTSSEERTIFGRYL